MKDQGKTEETWHEVGRQFEVLGDRLAEAVRATWEDERTRQRVQELQTGLESAARELERAIQEASSSPEGQRLRREAERAAESARAAGEQAFEDARPCLVSGLQRLRSGLQMMIERLEEEQTGSESPGPESDRP